MADANTEGKNTKRLSLAGVRPPERLSLASSPVENWKLFRQRWKTFALLSQLHLLETNLQVAMFLHVLDDEALRIYNGFYFETDEDDRTLEEVIAKFTEFVIGEENETYERFKFNQRQQSSTETFDNFLADLRGLVKSCNFCDNCRDSLIRDKVVTGIYDHQIRTDLLKERKLSLEKCIDICRSGEDAKAQGKALQGPTQVDAVYSRVKPTQFKKKVKPVQGHRPTSSRSRTHAPQGQTQAQTGPTCGYCGYGKHNRSECPARKASCSFCHKLGHFQKVCKARLGVVEEVSHTQYSQGMEEVFLGHVYEVGVDDSEWTAQVEVNGEEKCFKLDTGASVSVISAQGIDPQQVKPSDKILRGAGGAKLNTLGFLETTISYKGRSVREKLFLNFLLVMKFT